MSALRRLARSKRRAMGDKPNARVDAMVRVHPQVDRLITDRELLHAKANPPLDVQRSRAKSREWDSRIARRLAVPEHVRKSFAAPAVESSGESLAMTHALAMDHMEGDGVWRETHGISFDEHGNEVPA